MCVICPPLELELTDLPESGLANPASQFRPRALYINLVPSVLIQPDRPTDRDAAATGRPAPARALPEELMNVTKSHIGLVVLAIRSKEFCKAVTFFPQIQSINIAPLIKATFIGKTKETVV